jgi:hypothetical protein
MLITDVDNRGDNLVLFLQQYYGAVLLQCSTIYMLQGERLNIAHAFGCSVRHVGLSMKRFLSVGVSASLINEMHNITPLAYHILLKYLVSFRVLYIFEESRR